MGELVQGEESSARRMVPDRGRLLAAVRRAYNRTVREHLPRKLGLYNGVVSRAPRLLDATDHLPGYKAELVRAIRESVGDGDSVVVVGGGKGVAPVVAAEEAGDGGNVVTYEAGRDGVAVVREAIRLNGVTGRVEHAVVATPGVVRGESSARRVAVADLPAHDVLVLDCDGAELAILRALAERDDRPRRVVVETHGELGCSTEEVRAALTDVGYAVRREELKPGGVRGNAIVTAARD